jgi:KaiC/GvpD/RAD55 family RecA-like ATPase
MVRLAGLEEFLEKRGNTLLIKGEAGTGKTTLALQLLRTLARDEPAYYISARVSKEKLGRHNPESAKAVEEGGFLDLRLGNSTHMLEQIIKVLRGREKDRARVLVVDTWDSFAKEIEEKERIKAEKTLMALADTSEARIIFVSEEPYRTTMEYLVDGIVVLRRIDDNGLLLREFELTKLRGTPIPQHKHLFSLEGGKFTAFDYHLRPDYTRARKVKPKKDLDDAFSLGSDALDSIFYGIPKGSTFSIEYEPTVHYSSIRIVDLMAIINALNLGHGAFLLPLPASPLNEVSSLIQPYVSKEAYLNNFAIGSMEKSGNRLRPPFYAVGADDDEGLGENVTVLLEKVRKNSRTGGVLVVESMVQLESSFASTSDTVLEGLSARISKIQETSSDALLVTLNSAARMKPRVLAMSRRYARIMMRDRVAVIVGEKPSTEPYVLERDEDNSLLPKLTRIV